MTGHPDDILVTKRSSSAFYGTDLDLDLHLRRRIHEHTVRHVFPRLRETGSTAEVVSLVALLPGDGFDD